MAEKTLTVYRDGTYEKISGAKADEIDKEQKEWEAAHPPEPTPEERLDKLEKENAELRQALEILLGKETAVK